MMSNIYLYKKQNYPSLRIKKKICAKKKRVFHFELSYAILTMIFVLPNLKQLVPTWDFPVNDFSVCSSVKLLLSTHFKQEAFCHFCFFPTISLAEVFIFLSVYLSL